MTETATSEPVNGTRAVLLTGDGPEHQHVARALAEAGVLSALVVVHRAPVDRRTRLRRAHRRFGTVGLLDRVATRLLLTATGERTRRRAEIETILGRAGHPTSVARHDVVGVNSAQTRALLTELAPRQLLVYGTAVVNDATLSLAQECAINLHTGISPRYRGADCAFWPIHNGEPEWLGATVHRCTSALDGGAIYRTTRARLHGDEGVGGAFARSVEAGAAAFAEVVADVVRGHDLPVAQDTSVGREYRAAMRTVVAEYAVIRAVRRGALREVVDSAPA